MPKAWYDYRIYSDKGGGPFPNYDNTDVGTPADTPLTAPLAGTITADEYAPWGGQLTVKADQPAFIGNHPYYFMIHFDSINPGLRVGQHVNQGDFLGYSGGQNSNAGLPGLPPGYKHHTTDPSHSSGPHLDIGVTNSPGGNWDLSKQWSDALVLLARDERIPAGTGQSSGPGKACLVGLPGACPTDWTCLCTDNNGNPISNPNCFFGTCFPPGTSTGATGSTPGGSPGSLLPSWLQNPPWQDPDIRNHLARGAFMALGGLLIAIGAFTLIKSVEGATDIHPIHDLQGKVIEVGSAAFGTPTTVTGAVKQQRESNAAAKKTTPAAAKKTTPAPAQPAKKAA